MQVSIWRARCLASRGKHAEAARLWRVIAGENAATDPERFAQAVQMLTAAVPGAPASKERLGVLLELVATAKPRPREGWRVAGVVAAGSDRFDGFQLVFVPCDSDDQHARMSDWIGSHREHEVLIGGRGVRIIGIRGRAGADVDAFGLVGATD